MPCRRTDISAAEARRIALAAQGFDRPRPGSPDDARHYRRALHRVGVLQLDFVNVLVPAHFLILWSRLGSY
ncbi:MAG: winged helix-turn-helix domain-containing protein, partial [Gammaproteobacteria bacterium]|nr:winged helix-turn-helix domain-containing protein [Gammaproteobacteria bacterium]